MMVVVTIMVVMTLVSNDGPHDDGNAAYDDRHAGF